MAVVKEDNGGVVALESSAVVMAGKGVTEVGVMVVVVEQRRRSNPSRSHSC